jgi:Poxvirus D5 protein-like
MKHALGALGVLAAGVLLAVSAAINWRFGYGLGMTEFDKQIFGAASAAADCFKALVPFFFFAAWKNRMWSQVGASAVLWVVVTGYSFTSAIGHSAHNRMDTNGQRAVEAASYKDLRNDLKRAQDQMSWIPQHRPVETVHGEIETYKLQRSWVQTKSCTDVSGPAGRDFCSKYQGLLSERASGEQAHKWASEITEINAKLANAKGTNAMAEADPQAAVLAKLASLVLPGVKVEDVQTALAIFVAVLLEIGSGFGMYVAFSTWRLYDRAAPSVPSTASARTADLAPQPMSAAKPRLGVANDNKSSPKLIAPETDVIRFRNERIEDSEGTSLTATTLYEDYCAWCEEQQKEPLALPTFGREFGDLGVQKAKIAGRVRYIGIALKSGTELEFEEDKKLPATRAA